MDSKHLPAIQKRILLVGGIPVILDSDLAQLYGVETKMLNRAVSRNLDRFPEDFSFVLSPEEWENLKYQFGTSSFEHGGRRKLPRVFTEHGALMASTILRSEEAVKMSTFLVRAFVKMREELASNREVLKRLAEIPPFRLAPPYTMEVTYKTEEDAQRFSWLPGAKRSGDVSVSFTSKDWMQLMRFFKFSR